MLSYFKRKLHQEPERSLMLRCVILAAMIVPMLALARVHAGLWPYALLGAIGIAAGHWYSYHSLDRKNRLVRGLMFIAIHLALCWMFLGLAIGATVPQAQFAIFAQAITSFDLRYRSSLFNTLIHSLANLYVAATLSRTIELGLYLILFAGLVLTAYFVAERETGLKHAKVRLTPSSSATNSKTYRRSIPQLRPLLFLSLSLSFLTLLIIFMIFLLTPRFANRPLAPPFTLNIPLEGGITSEIINPGVPLVQVNGWSSGVSDYYYGFDTSLDLRYRGGLSDEVVMYVRSPSRSYWRSHSYDFYDGVSWRQSDSSLTDIADSGVYYQLPAPLGSPQSQQPVGKRQPDGHRTWREPGGPPRHIQEIFDLAPDDEAAWQEDQQIVQTFNIMRDQPNLVFAAYRASEIFIATERVSVDSGDGIRLPEPLKAGMTYSVVSYRPDFNPERLRQIPAGPYPSEVTERYLQLPDNISTRVRRLAQSLAGPYDNTFDQVQALNEHLLTEYSYNFFPPPHPPGAEVVDTFLFEDQEGICEQYVTALVVMARTLGIPARLVAGYGAGDYNPVTGYYEVRFSHAHSWAEIYFPGEGWVPFDPTPGWTPHPFPTPVQTWLLSDNGQMLQRLSGLNLPLGAIAPGGLAGAALLGPILGGLLLAAGGVLLALFVGRRLRRRLAGRAGADYSTVAGQAQVRRLVLRLYGRAVRLLARRRRLPGRRPAETAAEFAARAGESPALAELTQLVERAAYRPEAPDPELEVKAKSAWGKLKKELRR